MKKLLLIALIFGITLGFSATINESKTDIYFGNGVWNDEFDAKQNRDELQRFILVEVYKNNLENFKTLHYSKREDIDERNKDAIVLLSYNWDGGTVKDVYETYLQLKETGQMDGTIHFFQLSYVVLKEMSTKKLPEKFEEFVEQFEKLIAIAKSGYEASLQKIENDNIDEMMDYYQRYSFSQSHRVLMVAHSQGNLFANKIYKTELKPWEQKYMEIISVATPAKGIASDDKNINYVSNFSDAVIMTIPNALEQKNVNQVGGNGHLFVDSYLLGDKSAVKIKNRFNWVMDEIKEKPSQWNITNKSDEGTKEYRGTFTHRFNTSWDQLFGFVFKDDNKTAYVYQVPDMVGTPHYVKASYGGERILSDEDVNEWEAKGKQFYKLEGTDPVEYIEEERKTRVGRVEGSMHWIHSFDTLFACANTPNEILISDRDVTFVSFYYWDSTNFDIQLGCRFVGEASEPIGINTVDLMRGYIGTAESLMKKALENKNVFDVNFTVTEFIDTDNGHDYRDGFLGGTSIYFKIDYLYYE